MRSRSADNIGSTFSAGVLRQRGSEHVGVVFRHRLRRSRRQRRFCKSLKAALKSRTAVVVVHELWVRIAAEVGDALEPIGDRPRALDSCSWVSRWYSALRMELVPDR